MRGALSVYNAVKRLDRTVAKVAKQIREELKSVTQGKSTSSNIFDEISRLRGEEKGLSACGCCYGFPPWAGGCTRPSSGSPAEKTPYAGEDRRERCGYLLALSGQSILGCVMGTFGTER